MPEYPRGWLITVASRRMTDQVRSEIARRRREETVAANEVPINEPATPGLGGEPSRDYDDTLTLLFMCCHPALSAASQVALTLRAVGGLRTAEIARAFLVPETTMAQRISRAKRNIKASGVPFRMPPEKERADRLRVVLHVLYLIFNEGYAATSGPNLERRELTGEAIRLTRALHHLLPDDGEVAGLLALMLLTDARSPARTRPDGALVPLAEQDWGLWDQGSIREGVTLVTDALSQGPMGPYQLQAAIAAVHDEAKLAEDTDWPQILALYELLERISDNPVVTLNRAVAVAMVQGPQAGLDLLETLDAGELLTSHHRLDAVRAHLLEMAGGFADARCCSHSPVGPPTPRSAHPCSPHIWCCESGRMPRLEVCCHSDAIRLRRPSLLPAWRHAYAGQLMARSALKAELEENSCKYGSLWGARQDSNLRPSDS